MLPLPAGDWYVNLSNYLILQYLDPITGTWTTWFTATAPNIPTTPQALTGVVITVTPQ